MCVCENEEDESGCERALLSTGYGMAAGVRPQMGGEGCVYMCGGGARQKTEKRPRTLSEKSRDWGVCAGLFMNGEGW